MSARLHLALLAGSALALLAGTAIAQVPGIQAYASSGPPIETNRYGPSSNGYTAGPPRHSVILERAMTKIAAGEFRAARQLLENDVRGAPPAERFYLSGIAHSGLDEIEPARRAFGQALALDSDHVGALVGLALADIRLGREDEAAAALAELESRRARCAGICNHATALDRGARLISHYLAQPRPS